jgi:Na+-transporting NADH:ubiquinone oxidoreductase subunit NqrF
VDLPNTVFYACGPTVMVEESERLLIHELGVAKENIRVEKWG